MRKVFVRLNRRGMSLVELLVSIALLTIALLTVSQMFIGGVISAKKARSVQVATNRALQEVEKAKDMGYLNLVVDSSHFPSPYTIVDSTTVGFPVDGLPDGEGRMVIAPYPQSTTDNLKRVSTTVSWGGSRFTSGYITVSTLVANRP